MSTFVKLIASVLAIYYYTDRVKLNYKILKEKQYVKINIHNIIIRMHISA
jgi:hypothetical protein